MMWVWRLWPWVSCVCWLTRICARYVHTRIREYENMRVRDETFVCVWMWVRVRIRSRTWLNWSVMSWSAYLNDDWVESVWMVSRDWLLCAVVILIGWLSSFVSDDDSYTCAVIVAHFLSVSFLLIDYPCDLYWLCELFGSDCISVVVINKTWLSAARGQFRANNYSE